MRYATMLIVATFMGAAPAVAQHEGHGPGHMSDEAQELRHCTAMVGAPPPQVLLRHGEFLELTAEQVSRLENLQARAAEAAMPHIRPTVQAHSEAAERLRSDAPDFEEYEAALRRVADHMVQAQVAMARVALEAREVLMPQQLARLEDPHGGMMPPGDPTPEGEPDEARGPLATGMHGMMRCMGMDMHGDQGGAP